MAFLILIGIALFGIGAYLNIWIGRRKFDRRNIAGVEEFSGGYNGYLKTKAVECVVAAGGVLIGLAGFVCVFVGLIALTK